MALEWLTGNNLPQFWKNYLSHFERDENKDNSKRYVIFDMETTGLSWKDDAILSISAVVVTNNAIEIGSYFQVMLKQDNILPTISKSDVLKIDNREKIVEAEAIIQFLNFIKDATLVSHNVNLNIEMLHQALKRLDLGKLRNNIMDTKVLFQKWKGYTEDRPLSLYELCDMLKIRNTERNTTSGNAYVTALLFLKLKNKLEI